MMERTIMEAVAMADLIICQIAALPWPKIVLSFVIAIVFMKVVKYL